MLHISWRQSPISSTPSSVNPIITEPISGEDGIGQDCGNTSLYRAAVKQLLGSSDNEGDEGVGIMVTVLSMKRRLGTTNKLKHRIIILEQEKLQARRIAAGVKEELFALEKKFQTLQIELKDK